MSAEPVARPTRAAVDAAEASAAEWRARAEAAERRLRIVVRILIRHQEDTPAARAMLAGILADMVGIAPEAEADAGQYAVTSVVGTPTDSGPPA